MLQHYNWLIEKLDKNKHHREDFTCENEALDLYIRTQASRESTQNISKVFVLVEKSKPNDIAGYFTLNSASFEKKNLPLELSKKLPHYPIPAALLGRFAIHKNWQGKGLGKFLLMDLFEKVLHANEFMAIHALIVDAKDEKSKKFYEKCGFKAFSEKPMSLYITVATIQKLKESF